jgi:CRP/FNR family transcriptional regulator
MPADAVRERRATQATRQKPRAVSAAELRSLNSAFFADLATDDLEALGGAMFQHTYPAGQIVLLEGAASSVLYVVQAGRLKLFKTSTRGREQVLRLLRPGDVFNEVAVFDEGPNPASAQAIEDCTLYLLRQRDLVRFVAQRPGIALAITRAFARRLREALTLVEDLAFRDVTSRLAKILLEGEDSGTPRLTQELLAAMAGSRREVVGRALKALSQDGAIQLERGRIHVCNRRLLERLAWM